MKRLVLNKGWIFEQGVKSPFDFLFSGTTEKGTEVILPHDAMIYEERTSDCKNKNDSGYYPSKSYTYTKELIAPQEWDEKQVQLEFEGVMSKAMVYINEEFVCSNSYGYSQFFVDMKPYLNIGEKNIIKVVSINQDRNSRWYSGSGIYRNVNLLTGGIVSVTPEGLRVTTAGIEEEYAVLDVDLELYNVGSTRRHVELQVVLETLDGQKVATCANVVTLMGQENIVSHMRITVPEPQLWSLEQPNLYLCKAVVTEAGKTLDEVEDTFGIRTIKLDARKGLRINEKTVKLRGACIHHDNGVIGACTLEKAEEYRCRKLKQAGFNSIRSAHNPISKDMLRACDRLGMLVMDELSDMWNISKNSNDFSFDFSKEWENAAKRMVAKDYNHPSVVLYSIGNEIPEIGRSSGRMLNRKIANLLRATDSSRYVTNAISGLLALFSAPDFSEVSASLRTQKQEKQVVNQEQKAVEEASGIEKMNDIMGDTPLEDRDRMCLHPAMTRQLEEASCELDVVGFNYMTARHELENSLHPDRIVVGSETYAFEIPSLWKIVEENSHVIGDFTWTGYDYLGEAGIGIYYYDEMTASQGSFPDRVAYCGDINLNGYRRPVSYLREIAYGIRKEPFISVERVNRYGHRCLRNHWKYDDAVDSWTFTGYEGKPTRVKVLSPSEEVELFLNGISLGRKPAGKDHNLTAAYQLTYEPGELTAIGYDGGKETGRMTLHTAGVASKFHVVSNTEKLNADGQDALILEISLTDGDGIPNMWEEKSVTISVEGPAVLQGFGSADPSTEGSYQLPTCKTFDGRLIAVIRTGTEQGSIKVALSAKGIDDKVLNYQVV